MSFNDFEQYAPKPLIATEQLSIFCSQNLELEVNPECTWIENNKEAAINELNRLFPDTDIERLDSSVIALIYTYLFLRKQNPSEILPLVIKEFDEKHSYACLGQIADKNLTVYCWKIQPTDKLRLEKEGTKMTIPLRRIHTSRIKEHLNLEIELVKEQLKNSWDDSLIPGVIALATSSVGLNLIQASVSPESLTEGRFMVLSALSVLIGAVSAFLDASIKASSLKDDIRRDANYLNNILERINR